MNLNFNVTLLVILMLRKCLTYLRNSFIGFLFPLDDVVYGHKVVGMVATICVIGHVGMHFIHFSKKYWSVTDRQ